MTDACATTARTSSWSQPWLSSAPWDVLLITGPAFISSFIVLAFRSHFENSQELPLWAWVCLVLLVDVAHVYATVFRTYFDKRALEKNGTLLLTIPLLCWAAGALLYTLNALLFWRVLAYLAVFHFIRQQYGFMVLYSRRDPEQARKFAWLDQSAIYIATIYPLLFWHTHLPRYFSWFVDGDFITSLPEAVAQIGLVAYGIIACLYFAKELFVAKTTGFFNIPRNLVLVGTALSWWVGIVALNSDLAFTMTNVVSHGIPYMALVWLYHHGARADDTASRVSEGASRWNWQRIRDFVVSFAPAFLVVLAIFAYLEEGLWAGLVWREHLSVFGFFAKLPTITDAGILALLVPLLALPQSTHYVLDGFIWKVKDRNSVWSA
jgi:hypothetical protein